MISKRLINYIKPKKDILWKIVLFRVLILFANIGFVLIFANIINDIVKNGNIEILNILIYSLLLIAIVGIKVVFDKKIPVYTATLSNYIKNKLRKESMDKVFELRVIDEKKMPKGKLLQNLTEGIEQLDLYYSRFIPQLIYSVIAPLVLAVFLSFYSVKIAWFLVVLVPLIPVSLALIGKTAKKVAQKYWGEFSDLSNDFLESIEGLTLLKIYEADQDRADWMAKRAADFRDITMKVLSIQLNSIWVMDFLAYGGAAVGIFLALRGFQSQELSLIGLFLVVLLSIDYFLPLRLLGSYFHVAINGVAASDYIFALIDQPEDLSKDNYHKKGDKIFDVRKLDYSYDSENDVLREVSFEIHKGQRIGICGKSGSGKSTISGLLNGDLTAPKLRIMYMGSDISELDRDIIKKDITTINFDSYIFKGSLRENLNLGNDEITDDQMNEVLEKVNMKAYFETENGLDTMIDEMGMNLSGGQKQRIAFARALLKNSDIYILDEATSSIDHESEELIMNNIFDKSNDDKTWIIISHRIQNIVKSDQIFVFEEGRLIEKGSHQELIDENGEYSKLYKSQHELEELATGGKNE